MKKKLTKEYFHYIKIIIMIVVMFVLIKPSEVKADGLEFVVETIFPSTQLDRDLDLYYLETKPGETQVVEAKLISTSSKNDIEIDIEPTTAYSQRNGEIGYSLASEKKELDTTLKNPVSSLIEIKDSSVTLKPGEEKIVKFEVKAPKESYDGVKLGGIQFTQKSASKAVVAASYAYHIGVILTESATSYNDSATLELIDAKSSLFRGKKAMVATIQNPEPKILENVEIEGKIKNKETGKIVREQHFKSMRLAPNSNVDLVFDWGRENLVSGIYTMIIDGKNDFDTWHKEKEFRISDKEAKEINEASPYRLVTPSWIKYSALILIAIILIDGSYVILNFQKKKKEWAKYRLSSKKKRKSKSKKGRKDSE